MVTVPVPSIRDQLARPFDADEIRQRPGRGGGHFDYIDARSAHQRLDDVLGPGGWQSSFKVLDMDSKAVECTLSAFIEGQWVARSDVGYPNAADDADHDEREPLKAAYSDALKRAAVQLGIGRHLYTKAPAKREATPATPATQALFSSAALLSAMATAELTGADLIAVTGKKADGKGDPEKWFRQHPGASIEDLIKAMQETKVAS